MFPLSRVDHRLEFRAHRVLVALERGPRPHHHHLGDLLPRAAQTSDSLPPAARPSQSTTAYRLICGSRNMRLFCLALLRAPAEGLVAATSRQRL